MEILPTLERPGVMRFLPMNPQDTKRQSRHHLPLLLGHPFPQVLLSPPVGTKHHGVDASTQGSLGQTHPQICDKPDGRQTRPRRWQGTPQRLWGGQPEGRRWGRWPVTPAFQNLSFQHVGGEAGILSGSCVYSTQMITYDIC